MMYYVNLAKGGKRLRDHANTQKKERKEGIRENVGLPDWEKEKKFRLDLETRERRRERERLPLSSSVQVSVTYFNRCLPSLPLSQSSTLETNVEKRVHHPVQK